MFRFLDSGTIYVYYGRSFPSLVAASLSPRLAASCRCRFYWPVNEGWCAVVPEIITIFINNVLSAADRGEEEKSLELKLRHTKGERVLWSRQIVALGRRHIRCGGGRESGRVGRLAQWWWSRIWLTSSVYGRAGRHQGSASDWNRFSVCLSANEVNWEGNNCLIKQRMRLMQRGRKLSCGGGFVVDIIKRIKRMN